MQALDGAAASLASRQHSLITLRQLRDLAASDEQVRTRIRRGQWTKIDRSVIRINGAPVTWESKVLAAILGAGPGAVASHRTAAVLHGLEGVRRGPPEISLPRGRRYVRASIRVHQSTDLDRVPPTTVAGIPITPVARTLLDLGAVLPSARVQVALDDARRRALVDWDSLLATLLTHARRGRDGVGTLRGILDEHFGEVAVAESGFERLVVVSLQQAGLPRPRLQHPIRIGADRYRLDLAYPTEMVAIELDGGHHLRRDVWEADHVRQNALVNAGWTVLRFTWRDYLERRDRLIAEVRTALRHATHRN